jgi:hypothetical protein
LDAKIPSQKKASIQEAYEKCIDNQARCTEVKRKIENLRPHGMFVGSRREDKGAEGVRGGNASEPTPPN